MFIKYTLEAKSTIRRLKRPAMFLFNSRRPRGGQFISFEAPTKGASMKVEWQKSSSKLCVLHEGVDPTEATSSIGSLVVSEGGRRRSSSIKFAEADICANHVLVNAERENASHFLAPLKRCRELDALARNHAKAMASKCKVYHAKADDFVAALSKTPESRLGFNVMRGRSIDHIHSKMLYHQSNWCNMVDLRYVEMGMSSARGEDGKLYVCQIFRG